jgi:hypothetical protein
MAIKKLARGWDVRVVKALSRRGQLDAAAYNAHLEALPDEAAEGEQTETQFATPYADRASADVTPVEDA